MGEKTTWESGAHRLENEWRHAGLIAKRVYSCFCVSGIGVGVRIPIRVRFRSIRVSGLKISASFGYF